jgi:tRNA(Ile)-lysidine synthase
MLDPALVARLEKGKNLLAFSAGVDSTALFFLLKARAVPFDIALVNYHTRPQSDEEAAYAQELAKRYDKRCFIHEAEPEAANFESSARAVRYEFFESLIKKHGYTSLVTAHQLDDRLEWLLMQLSKGAGVHELLGPNPMEGKGGYTLVRPLLGTTKAALRAYLESNAIRFFEDESNLDETIKRNAFRRRFAVPLLEAFEPGIRRSFRYLEEDAAQLVEKLPPFHRLNDLCYARMPASRRAAVILADKILKSLGFLMRRGDKEALKERDDHIVGRRYSVSVTKQYLFIAPYSSETMDKAFKEECRRLRIPSKLRPYLFTDKEAFMEVKRLVETEVR